MTPTRSGLTNSAVLVLGMHRSGTSAVAAGLEQLGVIMGSSLLPGDEWNPKGYFEERKIVEFDNRLLDLAGLRWDATAPAIAGTTPAWAGEEASARDLLQEVFGGIAVWGLKDPRLCLLGAFWKTLLASQGVSPRLLLVLRDPAEVAYSLARRDGIGAERAAWLWFEYLLGSLEYVDEHADSRLVDFAQLLRAPAATLRELAEWLGLPADEQVVERFASEFISPQLSHGAAASSLAMPPLVVRAFAYWQASAAQGTPIIEALQAPEWLAIRHAFDGDIRPRLAAVRHVLEGDRQLSVMEERLGRLSRALTETEHLALDRLEQVQTLDSQLKRTAEALAFAEQLAVQRQTEMARLELQRQEMETLALRRLEELQALDQDYRRRNDQFARLEQELLERGNALSAGLSRAEHLAVSRLAQIAALDQELKRTAGALAEAQRLACERLAELKETGRARD